MPERRDAAERQLTPNEKRREREVIVLDEHDRRAIGRLFRDGVGKAAVDELVGMKVPGEECGLDRCAMTKRPHGAVREPVVVAVLFFRLEEHPAQAIPRRIDRDAETVPIRSRHAIAFTDAFRNPHP